MFTVITLVNARIGFKQYQHDLCISVRYRNSKRYFFITFIFPHVCPLMEKFANSP